MTRTLTTLTLTAALSASATPTASPLTDEAAVIDALHRACAAFEKSEADPLDTLLDERFTLTDSRGNVTTRADALAEVKARQPRYERFRNHSMKVRLYGTTALVNGITSLKGTSGGKPFEVELQFTDTLVKRDGQWVLVASHVSPVAG